jgi:urease accessory protein
VPGLWLERGVIDAADDRLLNSPLGLAGHRCMASMFFTAGTPLDRTRRDAALDAARAVMDEHPHVKASAGATSPNDRMVVVRVLAPQVEPAMKLLKAVRAAWREELWSLEGASPRIWAM